VFFLRPRSHSLALGFMPQPLSWIRRLSQIGTRMTLFFFGRLVGSDASGNRYYCEKAAKQGRAERRWVLYAGAPDVATVSGVWFLWLHHTMSMPLPEDNPFQQKEGKKRESDPMGAEAAWLSPSRALRQKGRGAARGAYVPWKPTK